MAAQSTLPICSSLQGWLNLRKNGVPPEHITLEITETGLTNNPANDLDGLDSIAAKGLPIIY